MYTTPFNIKELQLEEMISFGKITETLNKCNIIPTKH